MLKSIFITALLLVLSAGCIATPGECDDGNRVSGDGCSADLLVEDGYECSWNPNVPSVCTPMQTKIPGN